MDRTRKYHSELGNTIAEEHTWYAPTDNWILAQKLQIFKTKFTDNMKLKKKEDQSVNGLVLLKRRNKILKNGATKCGAETEGKAIQRLPHLEIHPIYSYQTQTLLWMQASAS